MTSGFLPGIQTRNVYRLIQELLVILPVLRVENCWVTGGVGLGEVELNAG